MVDLSDVEAIRVRLAKLCLEEGSRANPPDIDNERHRWTPFEVRDAASLSSYSDAGAWEFISEALMGGVEVRYQKPSEEFPDHAYIFVARHTAQEDVYVKIALCQRQRLLLGISFHYARY